MPMAVPVASVQLGLLRRLVFGHFRPAFRGSVHLLVVAR